MYGLGIKKETNVFRLFPRVSVPAQNPRVWLHSITYTMANLAEGL
jgi:hypothetical protein